MNRTKIEWTDWTWNPVTGCWGPGGTAEKPNRCSYCYAEKVARRFNHHKFGGGVPFRGDPFQPVWLPERLSEPAKVKTPSKIFVCSMADLFGDWVSDVWICHILNRIVRADCSQHTFQFLTKNPKRLKDFNPWPPNCWVGTTVTCQADADERLPWILKVDAPVIFVSHEPLLGALDVKKYLGVVPYSKINWSIIGGMTGPGAIKPKPEWVQGLIDQYRGAYIPLFLKDNLNWPTKIQE